MLPEPGLLSRWPLGADATLAPAPSGLINRTYLVQVQGRPFAVLQRLNTAVFSPIVHHDIEAVTAHLASRGIPTPRLIRTRDGNLWHTAEDAGVWRLLTSVGDRTVDRLATPAEARSAGALVARFHAATADLTHEFRSVRGGFHDTQRRMDALLAALDHHHDHRHRDPVARLADGLLEAWRSWGELPQLPARIVHGDLKVSNVRFTGSEALALIDLDTLGRGTLDAELGDALRSWCNPAAEDETPRFDLERFAAAMTGYAEACADAARRGIPEPTEAEWAAVVPGIERIALELAARFAADALEECYFGWDPARYATRSEHALARARGQAALAAAVRLATSAARRRLDEARAAARPPRRAPPGR